MGYGWKSSWLRYLFECKEVIPFKKRGLSNPLNDSEPNTVGKYGALRTPLHRWSQHSTFLQHIYRLHCTISEMDYLRTAATSSWLAACIARWKHSTLHWLGLFKLFQQVVHFFGVHLQKVARSAVNCALGRPWKNPFPLLPFCYWMRLRASRWRNRIIPKFLLVRGYRWYHTKAQTYPEIRKRGLDLCVKEVRLYRRLSLLEQPINGARDWFIKRLSTCWRVDKQGRPMLFYSFCWQSVKQKVSDRSAFLVNFSFSTHPGRAWFGFRRW